MDVIKHLGKVAVVAVIAFIGYTVFHIRDSAGLSVLVLVTVTAVYGIGWLSKRPGGVSRIVGTGVELFSPQDVPDLGVVPPDFTHKPSLQVFNPNAALYNPETYYQQFLSPTSQNQQDSQLEAGVHTGIVYNQQGGYAPSGFADTTMSQLTRRPVWGELPPGGATSRLQDTGEYDLTSVYRNAPFRQSPNASMPSMPPRTNMKQLLLGHGVSVDLNTFAVNTIVLEQACRGRDNLLRLVIEELARLQQPVLFIDTSDTYTSIANEFPFGHIVMAPQSTRQSTKGSKQVTTFGISTKDALRFGREILHNGWQVLFRFDSYESKIEAAEVLILILRGMDSWQAQRRSRQGVLHCFIAFTDAYRLFPDDPIHSVVNNEHAAQGFQNEVVQLLQSQGAMGLHFILGTRKISGMDAQTLVQIPQWFVKWPNEQEARLVSPYLQVPPQHIMSLPPELVLVCDLRERNVFPFRARESGSFHEETGILSATHAFPLLAVSTQEPLAPFQER